MCVRVTGIHGHTQLCLGIEDLNLDSHICAARTLPTDPSLNPFKKLLILALNLVFCMITPGYLPDN